MEVIVTSKGGVKVFFNGYMYTKSKETANRIHWKCTSKAKLGCRGAMSTNTIREDPRAGREHCHPPDDSKFGAAKLRVEMEARAQRSNDNPSKIISDATRGCRPEILVALPSVSSMKRTIQNKRPNEIHARSLADLGQLPETYRKIPCGEEEEDFVLFDSGEHTADRIIVFGTRKMARCMVTAETLYMDGNFAIAPSIFSQVCL